MPLTAFDNAYFLQSLGWAILNSFWQAGLLWLVYNLITVNNKNLSALFKYNLSLLFLFTSFGWFCITGFQFYFLLSNPLTISSDLPAKKIFALLQHLDNLMPFISIAYFILLSGYAARFMYHAFHTKMMGKANFKKAPAEIRLFTINTALHIGIKKKVQVWLSDKVDVPSVIGFAKPVILLPIAVVNHLNSKQVETILLHELAHIKRNDFLVNLLQTAVEVLLFFNPFAILLSKTAKRERENCCDDWVLNFQYNSHEYAKALLLLEEQRTLPIALALTATNGKKDLLHRVKRMFTAQPQINNTAFEKINLFAFAFLLIASIMVLSPSYFKNGNAGKIAETTITSVAVLTVQNISSAEKKLPENFEKKSLISTKKVKVKGIKRIAIKEASVAAEEAEKDYTEALVNEDLLQSNQQAENIATLVSQDEIEKKPDLLVKIEEEQSGAAQKNTYYFQMKNDKGNNSIKPLLILNKSKAKALKLAAEKQLNIKVARKKRVTT